jgi:hypothetical protein
MAGKHGNKLARSGYDRCQCGNKYFENDKCIDCDTHIEALPKCPAPGCDEVCGGRACWEHETLGNTGAASLLISLENFEITVHHSNGRLLGKKEFALKGDWNKLVDFLKNDLDVDWQVKD